MDFDLLKIMYLKYGKPISEELSEVLSSSISVDQRRVLAHRYEVSPNTVWNLVKRNTALSRKNKALLMEIIKEALLANEEKALEALAFTKILDRYNDRL